ncbi:D-glycero-beta-D-manno-heptose-7-phosphate kinase [Candidatus Sumerlaeota bacterium]|nr:D-glycero-beta-D-manno-heptose-7-phosphate kinase [Candidatus Sumerlaeota bacterium]
MNARQWTNGTLKELARLRVLVIGDVMLDQYVNGTVERTSPEAPVIVVQYQDERDVIGGAANVAHNLAAFGCKTTQAGVAGKDADGARLLELLRERGIGTAAMFADAHRPTTVKQRIVAHGQQILRIDRERPRAIDGEVEDRLIRWLERNLERYDGVVVSDYGKGVLTPRVLKALLALARKLGIPAVVDPKGRDYARYAGCAAIKPNLLEAQVETGLELRDDKSVVRAARKLQRAVRCSIVVITRGADGLTIVEQGKPARHIPAIRHEVYDVTGAGDTFAAFFSLGLFAGWPTLDAAELGNLASSVAVLKHGNATISPEELLQQVKE